MTGKRRLIYMPLEEITEADVNPKSHATDAINGSVARFGYMEPMIVDERTGKLVAGHGRRADLLARRDAGEAAPDGIEVRKGVWYVPVVRGWASADDQEAHAAGIALNRTTELGGWSDDLGAILAGLAENSALGLDGLGFDPDDVEWLLDLNPAEGEPKRERSKPAETDSHIGPVSDPVTRRGDLWLCGPHRVMCGDSFDVDDRGVLLEGVTPAAAVMDPPFAIYGSASGISASVADDKMVRPFFEQLGRVLNDLLPDYGHAYTCCDWRSYATLWDGFRSAGLAPKNCLVCMG